MQLHAVIATRCQVDQIDSKLVRHWWTQGDEGCALGNARVAHQVRASLCSMPSATALWSAPLRPTWLWQDVPGVCGCSRMRPQFCQHQRFLLQNLFGFFFFLVFKKKNFFFQDRNSSTSTLAPPNKRRVICLNVHRLQNHASFFSTSSMRSRPVAGTTQRV